MDRLLATVLFALASGAGCGPTSGGGSPDASLAPARPDSGGPPESPQPADAGPAPVDADNLPTYGSHTVGRWCTTSGEPAFFVTIGASYEPDSCYPASGIESATIVVEMASPPIGQAIDLSGASGSWASVCQPGEPCRQIDTGQITFESFDLDVGASGVVNLENGLLTGDFSASWCLNGTSCE